MKELATADISLFRKGSVLNLTDEDPDDKNLSESERFWAEELLNWVDQYYHLYGSIPSVELAKELGLRSDLFSRWLKSRPWREKLAERGVPLIGSSVDLVDPDRPKLALTDRQWTTLKVMTDLNDTRTDKVKLQHCDVKTKEWQAWLKDPVFQGILHAHTERIFQGHTHDALLALVDNVRSGDLGSIKLYMAMTGRYNEKGDSLNLSLGQVVNQIVEAVLEEVRDPETIQRVGMRLMGIVADATTGTNNNVG